MKLNYSKLLCSFIMAAAVVLIGVLCVLAVIGFVALVTWSAWVLVGVLCCVAFGMIWADAYKYA